MVDLPQQYDAQEAARYMNFARVPAAYEVRLNAGTDSGNTKMAELHAGNVLPSGVQMDIMRHDNNTAAVMYDPKRNEIIVTFDPTSESADRWRNANFFGADHALGGSVHSGFQDAIMSKNGDAGKPLIDEVKNRIEAIAAAHGGSVDMAFTGFSAGGSMATAAVAHLIADKFPETHPNIHLKTLAVYGSPPFGDTVFLDKFKEETKKLGVDVWRTTLANDGTPNVMTKNGAWYMGGLYSQFGTEVFLAPNKDGNVKAHFNPTVETKQSITKELPENGWHNEMKYQNALNKAAEETHPAVPQQTAVTQSRFMTKDKETVTPVHDALKTEVSAKPPAFKL
jgi:hypothetical protein